MGRSMVGWLFIGILLAILHYLRPDRKSFEQYYHGSKSTLLRWVGKLVMPPYELHDLFLICLVSFPDGSLFFGILGTWFPYQAAKTAGEREDPNKDEVEEPSKEALRLKGEKKFASAMEAFIRAASKLKDPLEAADCWWEAAKCAKFIKDQQALVYQERAARLYQEAGKPLRAANLYEGCGMFKEAIELYEKQGDGRSETLQAELAESLALQHRWSDAQVAWERAAQSAIKDPLITSLARRRMFLSGLCAIQAGHEVKIPEWLEETAEAMILRDEGDGDLLVGKTAKFPDWALALLKDRFPIWGINSA